MTGRDHGGSTSPMKRDAALAHLAQAEIEAWHVPGITAPAQPRRFGRAAIVGAGTMGAGIAMCFAAAGIQVVLMDTSIVALDRAMDKIRRSYASACRSGRLAHKEAEDRLGRIGTSGERAAVSDTDVVVEAVYEELHIKQDVVAWIEQLVADETLLASNTSWLDIDRIAINLSHSGRFLGLHFFGPAHVMRLLEIVPGACTAKETLADALELARSLGKQPVVGGNCHGFIGNRIFETYLVQAAAALLEGALPEQIDRVLCDFGMPMGPFQLADLSGLDVGYKPLNARNRRDPREPFYRILDRLIAAERRGQKSGAGIYDYADGSREPQPSAEVREMIRATAAALGIPHRETSDAEIRDRCLLGLANTGFHVIEEGVALRASDIDVVCTSGYGFPRERGGPMYWADREIGLPELKRRLESLHATLAAQELRPAPMLKRMVAEGRALYAA